MKIEIGLGFVEIEYEDYSIMFVIKDVPFKTSDLFNSLTGINRIQWMEWFRDDDGWNTPWIRI